MERYAPPSSTSRPRDIVAARWCWRSSKAAAPGPNKDYVYIDVRHLGEDVLEAKKLPDITEFARTYLGVDPVTELVPVYPTCHYVMGGIPTTVIGPGAARQRQRRARPVRRRRMRLRVGARRQPPRHQLAAGHQRVRPSPGIAAAEYAATRTSSTCRTTRPPW